MIKKKRTLTACDEKWNITTATIFATIKNL